MSLKRIPPKEVHELLTANPEYTYVDVRSVPEYQTGHIPGARNVPLLHLVQGQGMVPNKDFLRVMEKTFPKEAKLVIGCKSGQRSQQAANVLIQAGYSQIIDMKGGFAGSMDPFGRPVEPGWADCGLPVSRESPQDASYDELLKRSLA